MRLPHNSHKIRKERLGSYELCALAPVVYFDNHQEKAFLERDFCWLWNIAD